jgi:hypothetical protein
MCLSVFICVHRWLKDFGKVFFSFRISHCAFGIFSGEAVVEGVFEADEFAKEGVEEAVGVCAAGAEVVVEPDLGVEAVGGGLEQAGAFEAGAGDFDEAALGGVAAGVAILQALAHEVGAGELVEEPLRGRR